MDLVVKPKYALFLWRTSWLSLLSSLYALYVNLPDMSFVSFMLYCTSLLYWSNPRYNYIRNIDITMAISSVYYHVWKAYYNEYGNIYIMKLSFIILLYPFSWYLHYKKQYWLSIYAHGLLHLIGNISNILFYNHLYKLQTIKPIIQNI